MNKRRFYQVLGIIWIVFLFDAGVCCAQDSGCPENSHFDENKNICYCDNGYVPNESGNKCEKKVEEKPVKLKLSSEIVQNQLSENKTTKKPSNYPNFLNSNNKVSFSFDLGVGYERVSRDFDLGLGVESIYLKKKFPLFAEYKYSGYVWTTSKDNANADGQTNGWIGDQTSTTLLKNYKFGIKLNRVGVFYGQTNTRFNLDGYSAYNWWNDYTSPIAWNGNYADYRSFNSYQRSFSANIQEFGILLLPNLNNLVMIGFSKKNDDHPNCKTLEYRNYNSNRNFKSLDSYMGFSYYDYDFYKKIYLQAGATLNL